MGGNMYFFGCEIHIVVPNLEKPTELCNEGVKFGVCTVENIGKHAKKELNGEV
jgi:hypothetical protein